MKHIRFQLRVFPVLSKLHNAGMSVKKIKNLLKVLILADMMFMRYKELGIAKNRLRSGRSRSACTKENIKAVHGKVRRNPTRSMRKIANRMKINPKSIRTSVKTDFKLSSLKLKKRQHLDFL